MYAFLAFAYISCFQVGRDRDKHNASGKLKITKRMDFHHEKLAMIWIQYRSKLSMLSLIKKKTLLFKFLAVGKVQRKLYNSCMQTSLFFLFSLLFFVRSFFSVNIISLFFPGPHIAYNCFTKMEKDENELKEKGYKHQEYSIFSEIYIYVISLSISIYLLLRVYCKHSFFILNYCCCFSILLICY